MKRIWSAILFAAFVFLTACGAAPAATKPAGTGAETETEAETAAMDETGKAETEEKRTHSADNPEIAAPFDVEKLKALPVATAAMSEEELRDICVKYMEMQASIVWTPDQNLKYSCAYASTADPNGFLALSAMRRYGGQPYSSAARDIWAMLDHYDPETGVVYASKYGTSVGTILGNNCGTACYWGWARISSTITFYGTRTMCFNRGCIPLGNYTYDTARLQNFDETTTGKICSANGEQKMYQSYALLQKASGVVMYNAGITGHARMVKDKAVVVRNADGTINGEKSYVFCIEQYSGQSAERTEENGQVYFIGSREKKYTFQNLFQTGYLPFEVPELCGRATVQKATAELVSADKTLSAILDGSVKSNYCISRVDAIFSDASGSEVYRAYALGSSNDADQYEMKFSRVIPSTTYLSRKLKKNTTYSLTLTARLGNGETLTFFEGEVTY